MVGLQVGVAELEGRRRQRCLLIRLGSCTRTFSQFCILRETFQRGLLRLCIFLSLRIQCLRLPKLVARVLRTLDQAIALRALCIQRTHRLLSLVLLVHQLLLEHAQRAPRRVDQSLLFLKALPRLFTAGGMRLNPVGMDLDDLMNMIQSPQDLTHFVVMECEL